MVRELVQLGPLSEPLAPYLIADLLSLIQREPIDAEVQVRWWKRKYYNGPVQCLAA